jgi:hypothetical protein
MTEMKPFENLSFGHWDSFTVWPACAKPLRQSQVPGIGCFFKDSFKNKYEDNFLSNNVLTNP